MKGGEQKLKWWLVVSLTSALPFGKSFSIDYSLAILLPDVLHRSWGAVIPEVTVVFTDFSTGTVRPVALRGQSGVEDHLPAVHHGAGVGLHPLPHGDLTAPGAEILPAGSPLGPEDSGRAGEKRGEEESSEPEHDNV